MTEQTTSAGATPAAGGATPPQTPPAGQAPAAAAQPATGAQATDDQALAEPGKKALESERESRREAERRAKTAEDALKKLQDAQLSETEKRDKRLADLERAEAAWQTERQDLLLRNAVQAQATRLGFTDPGDALGLLDRSAIEFEESGAPKNLEPLLANLLKAKPYLAGRPAAPATGSADGGVRGRTGTISRDALKKMTTEEINAAFDKGELGHLLTNRPG